MGKKAVYFTLFLLVLSLAWAGGAKSGGSQSRGLVALE